MGNDTAGREVGQGIVHPRDQLCNILGMRQSGVFNEGWCLLEGEEGSGGGDEAGGRLTRSSAAGSTGSPWRLLSSAGAEASLGLERSRWRPPGGCVQVFTGTEGRVRIEQRGDISSFVIESAERGDEGRYTIKVTNPAGEDVASILLKVVGKHGGPEG